MDSSHLIPTAPAIHHTEFHDVGESVKVPESLKQHAAVKVPSVVNPQDAQRLRALRQIPRKTLVLCFDGTGNKFHGDSSDSNILKIFRMLDRSGGTGFHYYQPGIGTYVTTASLSTTGRIERLKNWYAKAKDSAIGTSFDQHVVGGYKFLMQFYAPGDDIYMFGFSRGAYTARFLSEMVDWVGLITSGNEEMIQFAWRTFSEWKQLDSSMTPEALKKRKKAYEFMVSFRETFSRPVRRIRYLGLFDTVNSVPRFENAMMRGRVAMPYSAKSSARVIRHAVSIDERRAKFRQDLISSEGVHKKQTDVAKAKHLREKAERHQQYHDWFHEPSRFRHSPRTQNGESNGSKKKPGGLTPNGRDGGRAASRYRPHSRGRSRSGTRPSVDQAAGRDSSIDGNSVCLSEIPPDDDESSDGDEEEQDINELWFPGGHADIGGGWELSPGEVPLSHTPLVWIVREARKAGLQFDEEKMKALGCLDESELNPHGAPQVPTIEVSGSPQTEKDDQILNGVGDRAGQLGFKERIFQGSTQGKLHDCLAYGEGLPAMSVLSWGIMEWIPFRRMDLRDDGSWKPIRWPLPRGEVRDMPYEAKIHNSAIKRMAQNPNYRPGNLIIGGGGRGVRKAPPEAGTGEWEVVADAGDLVGEHYRRKKKVDGPEKHEKHESKI